MLVFGCCLVVTSMAFAWSIAHEHDIIDEELSRRSASVAASIQRSVGARERVLDAVASFVVVTRGENRADLRNFVTRLGRIESGVAMVDWAPRVPADSLRSYEEKQWLQGLPDFRVHRAGEPLAAAQEYLPLHFGIGAGASVEQMDLTPGTDLSSLPEVAAAIASARIRRAASTTLPVQLTRPEGTHKALLMVLPVFAPASGPVADSDGELLGFAVGLVEIDAMVRDAIRDPDASSVTFELRDAGTPRQEPPLFAQRAPRFESPGALMSLWNVAGGPVPEHEVGFDAAGRRWTLATSAGERLIAGHLTWTPWLIAMGGIALSVGLAMAASGYATRGRSLAGMRRRLASERREHMEKLSRITDDLEREKLDRRRTEESLFREKQQFRLMFNAVPAMIFYKDTKNRFLLVNEAAATSMGRDVDEMEGRPCSEIMPAKAYELYRDDLEIIQNGKPKLGLIEQTELPGGKTIWMRTDKLPEYDAMGRVVGILVFSQDVTEHRQAEAEIRRLNEELEQRVGVRTAELRAANQELESFAYSVSHDLRTPLRTIDGFSRLVVEEHGDALPPAAHEYLQRLRNAAQRMGFLIDDLLKLTRVSRAEIRHEEVDLSAIARRVVEDLRRTSPDRRVDVVIEATPFAVGDPVLLANVIDNLIGNAWKFTGRNPEARIEFGSRTVEGGRTAFYVRDNGVGFDMVYVDKLFGAFQRLHSHEDFEGSGIGLATVQLIIRRHAGEVWAESVPDQGSTFYFTLAP